MSILNTKPEAYHVCCLMTWANYTETLDFRVKKLSNAIDLIRLQLNKISNKNTMITVSLDYGNLRITREGTFSNMVDIIDDNELIDINNWEVIKV